MRRNARQVGDGSSARSKIFDFPRAPMSRRVPRACPVAGRTPSDVGNTIWRQADSAPGRAVDCPTILWAVFCCGHPSTATGCARLHRQMRATAKND